MNLTLDQKEKLKKAIDLMVDDKDIQDTVKNIESSPMTTQNHYGRYMAALTPFAGDKTALFVIYTAMLRLGANQAGLKSALQVMFGGLN